MCRPRELRGLLLAQRVDRANGLRQRCVEQVRRTEQRGLGGTRELREQHLPGLEVGKLLDLVCGERVTVEVAVLHEQKRVCLGKVTQGLRDGDGRAQRMYP